MDINTISSLVEELNMSNIEDYPSVLKRIDIDLSEYSPFESWEGQNYTRNCIERNDRYELLLLCWNPHHETPIHGHDGQKCWVYQIAGSVEETRFQEESGDPVVTRSQMLKPGMLTYMDDRMGYHVLKNPSASKAMSLHLYVSPIDKCRIYNEETQTFETKDLCYDKIIESATML